MTKIISAYQARTNFGEIINQVYYQGEEIIVTKTGKPMVKIVKADSGKTPKSNFDAVWKKLRALATEGRQDIDLVAFIRKDRDSGHQIRP